MEKEMTTHKPSTFEKFMASNYGRAARGALGIGLIAAGLLLIGGTIGWMVAGLGLIPIAAGVLNLCPVAPLWGGHFIGAKYCGTKRE
jgi:hypothetical protein